jgi:hypothetical protein
MAFPIIDLQRKSFFHCTEVLFGHAQFVVSGFVRFYASQYFIYLLHLFPLISLSRIVFRARLRMTLILFG